MMPVINHNQDTGLNFVNEASLDESVSPEMEGARANIIMAKVQTKI